MAESSHLKVLAEGVGHWNQWRTEHPRSKPDLSGADLQNAQLSGVNLANAVLDDANLTGSDLSDADLAGATLRKAHLVGVDLSRATLVQADLTEANLIGATLAAADLRNALVGSVKLNYASMDGARLDGADFTHSETEQAGKIRTYYPDGAPKGAVPPPPAINETHLGVLVKGVAEWNRWRAEHGTEEPALLEARLPGVKLPGINLELALLAGADLSGTDLSGSNLKQAVLEEANLTNANLRGADLTGASMSLANLLGANLTDATLQGAWLSDADLSHADLTNADLTDANLESAQMVRTKVHGTKLVGCRIYGVSTWDLNGIPARQADLDISRHDQAAITVDDIKVAQFIYLILNNKNIRDVIDTVGAKGVLILGRFGAQRKPVLDALRTALRERNYLPMVFDFDKPTQRDFTETVMTLAGLSLFVIADITNPRSVPLELQATVPNYMIPFVPILHEGDEAFAMFRDLDAKFGWVLELLEYDSLDNLIAGLDEAIIVPALEKHEELLQAKARKLGKRNIKRYLPDSG